MDQFALVKPAFAVCLPLPPLFVLNLDDAAARDGCRRCETQITDFEEHAHVIVEHDAVGVSEREDFVVVHHRVHRLDPVCVQVAVENEPLRVAVLFLTQFFQILGEDALLPRAACVLVALEFRRRNRLRVDVGDLSRLAFDILRLGAALPARTFEGARVAHHEHAVADHENV